MERSRARRRQAAPRHPAEAVARLTISNPERRNALDHEILDALAEALPQLDRGIEIRCVLITGAPPVFSAGYDIASIPEETFERDAEALVAHPFHAAMEAISAHPWPTVAAINGHCLGGGLELAITCDLRICAATGAKLGMPPAKLGLIYGHTGLRKFLDTVGLARTKELFLTGRNLERAAGRADRPRQRGRSSTTSSSDAAVELAAEIAANAPLSMRGNKHAIETAQRVPAPAPSSRSAGWSRCASRASPPRTSARASAPSPRSASPSGAGARRPARAQRPARRRRPGPRAGCTRHVGPEHVWSVCRRAASCASTDA